VGDRRNLDLVLAAGDRLLKAMYGSIHRMCVCDAFLSGAA
jgi:hypothetical protein